MEDIQVTIRANGEAPTNVQDSAWVSQADDGDAMIIMSGAGLEEGVGVEVDLGVGGRMKAHQSGRPVLDTEIDAQGRDMVAFAPKVVVLEVYKGATAEEDRFVVHQSVKVNGAKGNENGKPASVGRDQA